MSETGSVLWTLDKMPGDGDDIAPKSCGRLEGFVGHVDHDVLIVERIDHLCNNRTLRLDVACVRNRTLGHACVLGVRSLSRRLTDELVVLFVTDETGYAGI